MIISNTIDGYGEDVFSLVDIISGIPFVTVGLPPK